jgi:hypothetical protein
MVALLTVLCLPFVSRAQTTSLRGLGVDERLDEPPQFARARDAIGVVPPPFVFVRLIVPRESVEAAPGVYTFLALDARMATLQGSPVLLTLMGIPPTAEEGEPWRKYVLAVSQRYRGKVSGYILGHFDRETSPSDPETYAYLLKLAAVQVRSVDDTALVLESHASPPEPEWSALLYREDIAPYFDGVAVLADATLPRSRVEEQLSEINNIVAENDPSAQVIVTGIELGDRPTEAVSQLLIETFVNLARGSPLTTFTGSEEAMTALLTTAGKLTDILTGEVVTIDEDERALDIDVEPGIAIRYRLLFNANSGSTYLVYWTEGEPRAADALRIQMRSFAREAPELRDPGGGSRSLAVSEFYYDAEAALSSVRVPLSERPMILEYRAPISGTTVAARAGLGVAEIIARHQQTQRRREDLLENYIASVTDEIHFRPTPSDSFDVVIESLFYTDGEGSEWEELSFSFNGARWGHDRPAFPLLQPEKVLSLPLDLELNQEYEYQLVGREQLGEDNCYVVSFEPLAETRSMYRGWVWIDDRSFHKLKVQAVQTQLSAPVVSNADVYIYEEQAEIDGHPMYLLTNLSSKQLVLIAGRNLLVEKESRFREFRVNSPDFEQSREQARASEHIMLKDTDEGLRYFVKRDGRRQVVEEFTSSAKALAIGTLIDPSFDFPLPIFGFNYLDFDFLEKNAQFALLFGGIFALGNIQKSNLFGGSFDMSLDFFGIAIKSNDIVFGQEGEVEEASLRTLPASLGVNFGWQATDFQKVAARYDLRYDFYERSETTAEDFVVPNSTFTNGFTLGYEYRRRGYSLLTSGSYARRADWEPWGDVESFDPITESYWRYRATLGKDFFFKTFHKIHVDAGYFGGKRLDRFTEYRFGLFDETRVRGIPSTVRFAELVLARVSYSFNVFDQFRFELFYDQGWGDDEEQRLNRVRFFGLGLGLNMRGPRHTILRVDLGKSFLPEALSGAGTFVAQALILKPL